MSEKNPKFKQFEVLVCDDDQMILRIMSHILNDMGFGYVKTTNNPETALMLIREPVDKPFAMIICDWNMPEMTGVELLQKLREVGDETPFVMLTSNVTKEAVEEARDGGVAAYIAKPFSADQVQRKVGTVALRLLKD